MRSLITILAITALAIGLYLILGNRDVVVVDRVSWANQIGTLKPLPEGTPSTLVKLVDDLRASTSKDVKRKDIEAVQDSANDAMEDAVQDLEDLTDDLKPSQHDSPEYKAWKEQAQKCAQQLGSAVSDDAGTAVSTTKDNVTVQHDAAVAAKACSEELEKQAQTLPDDEERKKSDKQIRAFQIVVGAVLVIVGAAMLIFANPTGATVIALGVGMLGCALDKDCGKGEDNGGRSDPNGARTPASDGPSYTPSQADRDAGFEAAGSSKNGPYAFLHSSSSRRWKVVDRESNSVVMEGGFSETAGYESLASSANVLLSCDITVDNTTANQKVSFVPRAGTTGCPNFEVQHTEGAHWVAVKLGEVPLQNASGQ